MFDLFVDEDPKLLPFYCKVQLVDKTEVKRLKRNPIKEIVDADNFYYKRYEQGDAFMGEGLIGAAESFVKEFLDAELKHEYVSEQVPRETLVRQINGAEFSKWAIEKSDSQCLIEISRDGCAACAYNGRLIDRLSLQLGAAGINLPIYRVDMQNKLPQLGNLSYAPVYMYVRREQGFITEIEILPTLSTLGNDFRPFLTKLARKCRIKAIKDINLTK